MTVPFYVSVIVALIAGVFAAIITPLVTAHLQRRNWQKQKNLELKYDVFRGAIGALALWLTDALDANFQGSKGTYKSAARNDGLRRGVEMRPETSHALEQHRCLVEAFFSKDVAHKFDEASRAFISIESVPNSDFEKKRTAFVEAAAEEMGIERINRVR